MLSDDNKRLYGTYVFSTADNHQPKILHNFMIELGSLFKGKSEF